jgi:hypothetical protein
LSYACDRATSTPKKWAGFCRDEIDESPVKHELEFKGTDFPDVVLKDDVDGEWAKVHYDGMWRVKPHQCD